MRPWLFSNKNSLGLEIESFRETTLIDSLTGYRLQNNRTGAVVDLKRGGAIQTRTNYAGRACIAAELNPGLVIWVNSDRTIFYPWDIDSQGNFVRDHLPIGPVPVSNYELFLNQDLNRDGLVGNGNSPPADATIIEDVATTRLYSSPTMGLLVQSKSSGAQPIIPVVWGNRIFENTMSSNGVWPFGVEPNSSGGYQLIWISPDRTKGENWTLDRYGVLLTRSVTTNAFVIGYDYEKAIKQDIDNDGVIRT